jgi:hypothetical protein
LLSDYRGALIGLGLFTIGFPLYWIMRKVND